MIHAWQAMVGFSAGAHVVALAAGRRAFLRYPTWLILMPLTAWGALTYDPSRLTAPWWLILFVRVAAAIEAAVWFRVGLPEGSTRPLAWLALFTAALAAITMAALHSGPSRMSHYLLARAVIHSAFAIVGLCALLTMWNLGLTVDRHALIVTLYLLKLAAVQAAARLITDQIHGDLKWMALDMAARLCDIALLC